MQTPTRPWLAAVAIFLGLALGCACEPAFARDGKGGRSGASKSSGSRGHHHSHRYHSYGAGGLLIAAAPVWPWWNYPMYGPLPAPSHYIERDDAPGAEWFYCRTAGGYYPTVLECPGGWERVPSLPQ